VPFFFVPGIAGSQSTMSVRQPGAESREEEKELKGQAGVRITRAKKVGHLLAHASEMS